MDKKFVSISRVDTDMSGIKFEFPEATVEHRWPNEQTENWGAETVMRVIEFAINDYHEGTHGGI